MKRKIRRLTEQIHNSRIHYDRILGRGDKQLMTEQVPLGPFYVYSWKGRSSGCNVPNNARIVSAGQGTAAFDPAQSAWMHQQWGSPQAGEIVGINHISNYGMWMGGSCLTSAGCPRCYEYIDEVYCTNITGTFIGTGRCFATNGNEYRFMGWTYTGNNPTYNNYGYFANCQDCVDAGNNQTGPTPSFDCDPNTLTCSDPGTGNGQYPTMADCTTNCSCDTTTASPCAVQWWQNPNATWASTWINNRDCSNYTWPALNLETQALALMASAPNPQPGPYNNWNDIWSSANAGWPNTTGGPKGQFIGKMAKSKFSQCQKQACNC
jgi:hypothetical protein